MRRRRIRRLGSRYLPFFPVSQSQPAVPLRALTLGTNTITKTNMKLQSANAYTKKTQPIVEKVISFSFLFSRRRTIFLNRIYDGIFSVCHSRDKLLHLVFLEQSCFCQLNLSIEPRICFQNKKQG